MVVIFIYVIIIQIDFQLSAGGKSVLYVYATTIRKKNASGSVERYFAQGCPVAEMKENWHCERPPALNKFINYFESISLRWSA